jgi:hypothetical protein
VLAHQHSATDLLFFTLRKSEALFSPSTRYRDLALGPALFHWESKSTPPPPPPPASASAPSTTLRAAPPPNRSCASALPATKATMASGSCSSTSGDSLAAGAADPDGLAARLLLGIKVALVV